MFFATRYKNKAGSQLEIYYDESVKSPREKKDNLGTIFSLDKNFNECEDIELGISPEEDVKILKKEGMIYLHLYKYELSNIIFKTSEVFCKPDSGQIGYIYASKEKIRKWFNVKRISKKTEKKALSVLVREVKELTRWVNGECYFYILKNHTGKEVGKRGGFLGVDYLLSEFKGHGFEEE